MLALELEVALLISLLVLVAMGWARSFGRGILILLRIIYPETRYSSLAFRGVRSAHVALLG